MNVRHSLTLYQPMTHICVMSSHKPIRIYMGGLILGVNTLYRLICFFKLFPMVGKGLTQKRLFDSILESKTETGGKTYRTLNHCTLILQEELHSLQLLRVWLSLASLAQSQGVMSWLASTTPSVAYARFARSLTWA